MEMKETTLKRRDIFCGRIMTIHEDEVLLPDGKTAKREILDHNGGVCVAAMDDKGRLAFVHQFRYAYGKVITELPAGKLEKGEEPDEAIKRELHEEVGAQGYDWKKLGTLYPSPGYTSEIIHLYFCRLGKMGEQELDEDEFLDVEFIGLTDALDMVMRGEIEDAKSQTLILKTAYLAQKGQL